MKINITYATILGTSQMLAEDLEDALSGAHEVSVTDIMHLAIDDLYDGSFHVFISSTTGRGELPDSATDFVADLNDAKPDLSALNFAIFGLGDMGYAETFNMGSQRLADLLKGCGATQIGERGIHDASTDDEPEDIAVPWLEGILAKLPAHAEAS
jgi:MioC protein